MSGHTYDKWKELGFQVKKGEKAAYKYYGKSIFTKDQVVKISNIDEDFEDEADEPYYPSNESDSSFGWDKDTSEAYAFWKAGLGSKF